MKGGGKHLQEELKKEAKNSTTKENLLEDENQRMEEHSLKEVEDGHEGGDQDDEGGEEEDRGGEVGSRRS